VPEEIDIPALIDVLQEDQYLLGTDPRIDFKKGSTFGNIEYGFDLRNSDVEPDKDMIASSPAATLRNKTAEEIWKAYNQWAGAGGRRSGSDDPL